MAKRIIPIEVRDEYILGAGRVIGAKGSHDDVALRVEFNEMWRGKSVTAVWLNAVGESPVVAPINFSNWEGSNPLICIIDIPAKAKSAVGDAMLTIRGFTSVDGETESTATLTATAYFKVLESDFDNEAEEEEEEDKLNLYKQLQNDIAALETTMSNAIDASDKAVKAKDTVLSTKEEIDMTKADIDSILVDCQSCADNAAESESNASTYAENAFGHMEAAAISAGAALGERQDAEKAQAAAEAAKMSAVDSAKTANEAAADAADFSEAANASANEAASSSAAASKSASAAAQSASAAAQSATQAAASASTALSAASKAHSDVEAIQDTIDEFMDSGIEEAASAAREEVDRILAELEPPIDEAIGYANDAAASADRAYREAERAEAAADRAEAAGGGGGDVSKAYVDAELAKKLDKTGGTLTGDLNIGSADINVENGNVGVADLFSNWSALNAGNIKMVTDEGTVTLSPAGGLTFEDTFGNKKSIGGISYIEEIDPNAVTYSDMEEYVEEYVAANGGAGNVAYDATPLVTATATDPDGNTYTGATEYAVTIPNADELFVGMQITVVPTMKSATMKPFITVNGARGRIYTNAATTGAFFNGTRVDFIGADKPLALMYMGIVDEANNIGGWKCLNSVRVNVEALMSNGEAGVNKVPYSNGVGEKLVWRTHKDASLVGDATYKSSANRYDVTLPGIGNLATGGNGVYKGLEVTIIPDVTNKAKAKLAVNNHDGTASGSQIYLSTGEGTEGFVSIPAGFLKAGMPVKMKYTGAGWRITDTPYSVFGKSGGTMSDEEGISETTLSPYGIDIRDNDFRAGSELGAFSLDFTFSGDEGKEYGGGAINGLMYATADHQAVPYGQMKTELDEVKTSVGEGKALIASAVTDKGVETADDATFAQMAANIAAIESGGVELPELANEGASADLRKDKELINDEGEVVVGTMETFYGSYECSDDGTGGIKPIIDGLDVTPTATDRTYDATEEGLDGYSPVVVRGDGNLAPENIVEGVSIFGVTGTAKTDVEPNLQDIDITPSYMDKIYNASDGYDGFGEVYVNGDPNLVPENVVEGVKIFDVTGTAKTGGGGGETVTLTIKPLGPMGITGVLCYIDGEGKSQLATTKGTVTALKGSYASCINGGDGTMQTGNQTLYTGTFGSGVFVVEADGVVKI